ncbi:MAG: hypothetical protein ACLGG7_02505 [Bacteriovoracia bacterium]
MRFLGILALFMSLCVSAQDTETSKNAVQATFPARVSRINNTAEIIRVRLNFKNAKFLNRSDRVEFWNETYPDQRCVGVIEARSNEYLLIKVPELRMCISKVHITTGSYLHFWSKDLENNLKTAYELVEILLKKRMALLARKRHHQRELDGHVEKVEAINRRYEVLRQKLEIEWGKDLAAQEEDKANALVAFKQAEARLNEVESKLESYRIHEHNFTVDRWSLDPDSYIHK